MLNSSRRRKKNDDDIELNMVLIMNMFLVLIPFLLLSASFFHLKAINTSVPVLSDSSGSSASVKDTKTKITVIVEIKQKGIKLSTISDSTDENVLSSLDREILKKKGADYPLNKLAVYLEEIKAQYPRSSDTVIIIPHDTVEYDTIIQAMDIARYSKETPLFPKVILSGKVG